MRFKARLGALCYLLASLDAAQPAPAAQAAEAQPTLPQPAVAQPTGVQVTDAWIRWLPARLPAGGYATLRNSSDRPLIVVSVSSSDYGAVSLHRSRTHGSSTEMVPVEQITLAPHSSLNFARQGLHIMLMQPRRLLKPGDHVPIALHFAGGQSLTVEFELRRPDSSGDAMAGMPGM